MDRINELMKRYAFVRKGDNLGAFPRFLGDIPAEEYEYIRTHKQEILAIVDEEERQREEERNEYQRKLDSIDGLAEIQDARRDLERWHIEWDASFSGDCGGLGVRPKPQYDFPAMYAKYPRAAAYLRAQEYSYSSNYAKSGAGKKAVEKIVNGEDYEQAIQQMEQEWQSEVNSHIWD